MARMRPANTVVLLTDNHAQSALGCFGEKAISTPAIDSIARHGVRFTNAYSASPLCCPARAALATGSYPHETGFFDNVLVYDGSVPSWMHRARDAARKVVSVGKLHFRSDEDDNGFSEEIIPMHILNKRGGTAMLLRAVGGELQAKGQWELYTQQSGVGTTVYQQYDRDITHQVVEWLRREAQNERGLPWILFVSFASPHPPFKVPRYLDEMYALEDMPLPAAFDPSQRSEHPAAVHLRKIMGTKAIEDPDLLRRVAKGYFGLITHIDHQIGEILGEIEALDLGDTRLIYTSDHGEMLGAQGIFGKSCVYEGATRVPLIISGTDMPENQVVDSPVSHIDLFQTILESAGVAPHADDAGKPGRSLLGKVADSKPLFAEYHATGTTGAAFVLRLDNYKLIYHVDHPNELFDLADDPHETRNLAGDANFQELHDMMVARLKDICDPDAADRSAKLAQQQKVDEFGGRQALIDEGALVYTPPPGRTPEIQKIG